MADRFRSLLSRLWAQTPRFQRPLDHLRFHSAGRYQSPIDKLRSKATARFAPFITRNSRPLAFLRELSYYLFIFATWVPVLVAFNHYFGETTWIYGASMFPQFNPGIDETTKQDAVWTRKWRPLEGLRRGMVVELRYAPH